MKLISLLLILGCSALSAEDLFTLEFKWDRDFVNRIARERCKANYGYYPGSEEAARDVFNEKKREQDRKRIKDYPKRIEMYLTWNPDQKDKTEIQNFIHAFEDMGIVFCDIQGSTFRPNGEGIRIVNTKENIDKYIRIMKPKEYNKDWMQNQTSEVNGEVKSASN